jgi:hypothetical protein
MKMKQLVLNMVCRLETELYKSLIPSRFLRDVAQYYWDGKTILREYEYLIEPPDETGGYRTPEYTWLSYESCFEYNMFSKNYTKMFKFFPCSVLYKRAELDPDYNDIDPRPWVKSERWGNVNFIPLKKPYQMKRLTFNILYRGRKSTPYIPHFLRTVAEYYWTAEIILREYEHLVELGSEIWNDKIRAPYEERFKRNMLSKNYTKMFKFFPCNEPHLECDYIDHRAWIKFYMKSKGCENVYFPPLRQACRLRQHQLVRFIVEKNLWKKEVWENFLVSEDMGKYPTVDKYIVDQGYKITEKMQMKHLVLNMLRPERNILPLFLRDVGKYYWNQTTVLRDYKKLSESDETGGYLTIGQYINPQSERARFEHEMLSKNYTKMFPFFPTPNLEYDDVDPRVWVKFYVKSKGCENLDFPPLKRACKLGDSKSVLFMIQKKVWEKNNWEDIFYGR